MIQVGGAEFAKTCVRQDIGLDELLSDSLRSLPDLEIGTPTSLLYAIKASGDILAGSEGEPLATRRNLRLPRRMLMDPVAGHLARIINYSREPDPSLPLPTFKPSSDIQEVCPQAEYYFLDTLEALKRATVSDKPPLSCQIVCDSVGPLLIRKNEGEPSALTLRPIAIGGIPFPSGSLVNARLIGKPNRYKGIENRVDIIDSQDVDSVGFLRLSAFALGSFRRKIDFHIMHPYQLDGGLVHRNPNYMRLSMQSIGKIALDFVTSRSSQTAKEQLALST